MANIKVAIKLRPLIDREKRDGNNVCWKVRGNNIAPVNPLTANLLNEGYTFDHVFGMEASNTVIFDQVVKPLVMPTVNGFNTTIFAYGQTSSGKTHTMLGSKEEPGIIPLTVSAMFDAMQQSSGREFLVRASYMEIYNERINDLLHKKENLKIREEDGKAVVPDLREELVSTTEKILLLMRKGQENRHISGTNMNERSSRSHTIFRLIVESREARGSKGDCNEDDDIVKVSHLNMVDLAGSERPDQTGNKVGSDRFREGCHINLSLFTLSQVISQLSEGKKHISFRDSKLTRILEPALGGNALTAIVCNVTPASIEETNSTLSFASRAKKIKNEPHVNEVLSNGTLLKRYARQLAKLKEELKKAKSQDTVLEMESKLLETERLNNQLQERIDRLSKQLIGACVSQNVADSCARGVTRGPAHRRKTWAGAALCTLTSFQRLEPIPESPLPSLPKEMGTLTEHGTSQIPFEEFEKDLLESDEAPVTPADLDELEFFPSSFVSFRRGSERNRSGMQILGANVSNTDDQQTTCFNQAAGTAPADEAAGTAPADEAAGTAPADEAIQTEQPSGTKSPAMCHHCSMGALSRVLTLHASCQTSPITNNNLDTSSGSVSTPPHIIRASLKQLEKDYEELREFTTLERQILNGRVDMVSISVQTATPCNTKDTRARFAVQMNETQSSIEIVSQEQPTSDMTPKLDRKEENGCVLKDVLNTTAIDQNIILQKSLLLDDNGGARECCHSLLQLRSQLEQLTAENITQKAELNILNSNNEKLRNRMLTEIATLAQLCSDDTAHSYDNLAIFNKFVNSIMQKEQEVVQILSEDSKNKLVAKENWISHLEKHVASLEEELDNSQKERNILLNKLKDQKETIVTLERNKVGLKSKVTKSESDMSFLQEENKDLALRLRAAEEKILSYTENERALSLNLHKERERTTLLENDLRQMKEKCELLGQKLESTLENDEKLLLSEANKLEEKIQKLEQENASLVETVKISQGKCLKAKAAATQSSECLKSVRNKLVSLISVFPDSSRVMHHTCEQIIEFMSKKLSQPCDKCYQLGCALEEIKLERETLKKDLAGSMEKQKQLECKLASGSLLVESELNRSVVYKCPTQASVHCGLESEIDTLPVKNKEACNQKMVSSIGINTIGGCRCEELEKDKKQLIQEAVARRCKIAQLQEEVSNQDKLIERSNTELKEAQHKIRVYKMELKQLQRTDWTSSQVMQSRKVSNATSQTDEESMFINFGCGVVTRSLVEDLRLTVFDLRKKYENLKAQYRAQTTKVNMLENKVAELKGEKKTFSNVRVQTDDIREATFSCQEVQVDMHPVDATPREIGQILFWKSKAERHLESKKFQEAVCAKLREDIKRLKQKPEPLSFRNLTYTSRDPEVLCLGLPKPVNKENVKYPYIDKT